MKLIRLLLTIVCLAALTACGSGSDEDPTVEAAEGGTGHDRAMIRVTVSPDGTLDFTGSGEFEGFAISVSDPALAGRTIFIEKTESEYYVDGYVSLSFKYAVRFKGHGSGTNASDPYDANVTLPFIESLLAAEGGAPKDVRMCSRANGAVVSFNTSLAGTQLVQADASIPANFFAGYLKAADLPQTSGAITIAGRCYKAADKAGRYLTDPKGIDHPDSARGIDHVQPGELVLLALDQDAFGDLVTASSWRLSVPAGSSSVLIEEGEYQTFIPDMVGSYQITLEIEGANGDTSQVTRTIAAQSYSLPASGGEATCLNTCHNGTLSSSGSLDRYGRSILRDMVTPWRATAHAGAFARITNANVTYTGCFQCHSTGFLYADRDGDGIDEYAAASGFDDTITDWDAPAATGSAHLQGVTCEACHGPGGSGGAHYSETSLRSSVCLSCHSQQLGGAHFFGYAGTHSHAHTVAGGLVAKNAACFKCHTGEGMLGRIFGADVNPSNTATVTGIGCAVCHDPHGEGDNEHELRVTGTFDIRLASGDLSVNAGNALICCNCHTADTQLPAVGTSLHNSQVEMLNGVGGYDYGENLSPVKGNHGYLTCNYCHMSHKSGTTHDMNMTEDTAERIASCQASPCHATRPPAISNGHYDLNENLVAVRADIAHLADTINDKAGYPAGSPIKAAYSAGSDELATALTRAAYNYNFILSDSSFGFHNPVYAQKLITLSLEDLARF